jgi:endonuclease YncB( thermonuclease family)
MKYLIVISVFWFSCASISPGLLYNDKTYGNAIVDSVITVNRGDCFKADIKNFPEIIGENITIYIFGVSSPSISRATGSIKEIAVRAKRYTEKALKKANEIELRNIQRGKPFVIVADVYIDGKNLAKKLIRAGLGKEYYSGKTPSWP